MRPQAVPADGTEPLSIVPGMGAGDAAGDQPAGRRFGPPVPLTEAWLLARKNPLEAVAVVLLGVGGLIFPCSVPGVADRRAADVPVPALGQAG